MIVTKHVRSHACHMVCTRTDSRHKTCTIMHSMECGSKDFALSSYAISIITWQSYVILSTNITYCLIHRTSQAADP